MNVGSNGFSNENHVRYGQFWVEIQFDVWYHLLLELWVNNEGSPYDDHHSTMGLRIIEVIVKS